MAFRIKELREEQKMSQEELANKAGVSRIVISNLETGARDVTTTKTLAKIAGVLNVRVQDLFFDEIV